MLTKKHFKEIARALAACRPARANKTWTDLRNELARVCSRSNPNFDRARFNAATEGK